MNSRIHSGLPFLESSPTRRLELRTLIDHLIISTWIHSIACHSIMCHFSSSRFSNILYKVCFVSFVSLAICCFLCVEAITQSFNVFACSVWEKDIPAHCTTILVVMLISFQFNSSPKSMPVRLLDVWCIGFIVSVLIRTPAVW